MKGKVNGKSKGSRFERELAKTFSNWYFGDPDAIVRNATSGALSTTRGNVGIPSGDLQQIKHHENPFPYSVEAKHHKEFKIEHLLFERPRSKVYRAWVQCRRDALKDKKIPLLVFKVNFQASYCVLDIEQFSSVVKLALMKLLKTYCVTGSVLIVSLDDFLKSTAITDFFKEHYNVLQR